MKPTRFDILDAYYWHFVTSHTGQGSTKYRRLSKMLTYYTPSRSVENGELSEEAQYVFVNLERRHF